MRRHADCRPVALSALTLILATGLLIFSAGCGGQDGPVGSSGPSPVSTMMRVQIGSESPEQIISVSGPFQLYDLSTRRKLMNPAFMNRGRFTAAADGLHLNGQPLQTSMVEIVPRDRTSLQIIRTNPHGQFVPASYRGNMRILSSGQGIRLINVLDIDEYLYSVVGKETYSVSWHLESQKAQAIAARSYALHMAKTVSEQRDFDVFDTVKSQAYPGMESETTKSRQAVDETRGVVVTYGQPGQMTILSTFYSSTCGGSTLPAHQVFGPKVPDIAPLVGVECTWCSFAPNYRWKLSLSKADFRRALGRIVPQVRIDDVQDVLIPQGGRQADGTAVAIAVVTRNAGRQETLAVPMVRLRDEIGTVVVKSTRILDASMAGGQVTIEGVGFGHRVGMCQFGAEGQARAGRSAGQIIRHYYPQSKLTRVY